jgi:ribosome maturation factor RimP
MQAKEIVKFLEDVSTPILEKNGFEFVDAEFVKEGPGWYLRLYADKEGGITIDELEYISKEVEPHLSDDITEQQYIFEVSSPGIDRILKRDHEYVKYKGRKVDVKLFKALDGCKEYSGELVGLDGNKVVIKDETGNELSFERSEVASTRLAIEF